MFPIKDDNPTKSKPIVTYLLIFLNIAVFAYEVLLGLQNQLDGFIYTYALIPRDILSGTGLYTLLTSMFMHSGVMHIFSNMLYLWIFGDNIEDILGSRRFLGFYLLSGLAASAMQIYVNPSSTIPNLGASGAIAGVLGAYLVTFPRARVHCVVIFGFFIRWVALPAVFVLFFWFVLQLFSGIGSLAYMADDQGGVAYFAHIGGFIAGVVLVKVFRRH
ncbi:MAG: rhomboid family intramembrane serine protease [Candidatus Hydrothermarchaeota archaeon]|nr:rhomboid family intramembrane serine protease [Candidatus Hydrothermarchaeota archaeon]